MSAARLHDQRDSSARVLVPVKAFDLAKQRLADLLSPGERAGLARAMADSVLLAARPLDVVVVCDDDEVALWAQQGGASVCWTPGHDLNSALTVAIDEASEANIERVVVAHADLPFATDLARFATPDTSGVVIVADRHGRGTNVMSLPTSPRFELSYGPDSRDLHTAAATAVGLSVEQVADRALSWDVDEPADLSPPDSLGTLPGLAENEPAAGDRGPAR